MAKCRMQSVPALIILNGEMAKMEHIPPPFSKQLICCVSRQNHSSADQSRCSPSARTHSALTNLPGGSSASRHHQGKTQMHEISTKVGTMHISCRSKLDFMCINQAVETGVRRARIHPCSQGGVVGGVLPVGIIWG